jgi:hypothetical protein
MLLTTKISSLLTIILVFVVSYNRKTAERERQCISPCFLKTDRIYSKISLCNFKDKYFIERNYNYLLLWISSRFQTWNLRIRKTRKLKNSVGSFLSFIRILVSRKFSTVCSEFGQHEKILSGIHNGSRYQNCLCLPVIYYNCTWPSHPTSNKVFIIV